MTCWLIVIAIFNFNLVQQLVLPVKDIGATENADSVPSIDRVLCGLFGVSVEYYDAEGESCEIILDRSMENSSCNGKHVHHIEIVQQDISQLWEKSIANLPDLESITIVRSGIDYIEPGAFYNLPRIKNISLIFNNFVEVSKGVFNSLPVKKVLISNPMFKKIGKNAFSWMKNLTYIGIHYSRIRNWNKSWFTGTESLETIDFRYGLLESIPSDSFEGLPNLKCISLRNNMLKNLEPNAFQGLTKLKYLGLNSNNLSNISADAFSNSTEIEIFNIEKNKLNFLSRDLLERITTREVYLWGNPWTCSCFDEIKNWLAKNNGSIYNNYNCIDFRNPTCINTNEDTCAEVVSHEVTRTFARKFSNKGLCVVPVPFF